MRLAGEDSGRGTFTQRHAVLINPSNAEEYNPLDVLARSQGPGKFLVYNSALTEYAGMGFEYGYSVGNPDAVVAWEAQFGDFANGAQTIIDEYVSSGEAKWGQTYCRTATKAWGLTTPPRALSATCSFVPKVP